MTTNGVMSTILNKAVFDSRKKLRAQKKELLSCNLIGCKIFVAQSARVLSFFFDCALEFKYFELVSAELFARVENDLKVSLKGLIRLMNVSTQIQMKRYLLEVRLEVL